jgi:hypothetical protein
MFYTHRAGCFSADGADDAAMGKNKARTRRAKIPPHTVTHFQHRHITNKQQVHITSSSYFIISMTNFS